MVLNERTFEILLVHQHGHMVTKFKNIVTIDYSWGVEKWHLAWFLALGF